MRFLIRAFPVAAALALCAAGCSHAQQGQTRTNTQPQFTAQQYKDAAKDAANKHTDNGLAAAGSADLDAALRELANVSVFFAFDEATLTPDAEAKLSKVADVLTKHDNLSIQIQGNCDERGTEAYNLALGQKRADSAKNYLTRLGVKPAQINTISFGDEKPKVNAHDEAGYSQNRRDDVVAK